MSRTGQRNNDERELGFGSRNYNNSIRFIDKQGQINIKRKGLGGLANFDVYHWLISTSRTKLSLVILAGYIFINLLFATIYYSIGVEFFGGIDGQGALNEYMNLFFFSAQTITTLGYGHIYPIGNAASTVAAVESLLGLLSFAIATGILFGRFSRPEADLLYSENILIAPYKEMTALMFRIANKKQYELIESEVSVNMSMTNPETNRRDFFNLKLELNRINFFPLSWTLVHAIDDQSPVYGLTLKDLEQRDAEVIILFKAVNDTFSQTVHSRHSYKWYEIVSDAKFKPLKQDADKKGRISISVTDIHHYEKVTASQAQVVK